MQGGGAGGHVRKERAYFPGKRVVSQFDSARLVETSRNEPTPSAADLPQGGRSLFKLACTKAEAVAQPEIAPSRGAKFKIVAPTKFP
jgi:hypothetical protein